ncbi:hypothetical protein K443DRAFT_15797 [Laccaria amethystina LaAM-08-1]|uniref:Uncharacterized protein n=1 Tax=Laccaria amethystina LaAM-08-1 TaxID=1095629 RepID=A0A0C9WGN9_9AGAR|nr:hypothetical protein K443DRAFT_15797 [Laccaria amethystina LaAM-08-1]
MSMQHNNDGDDVRHDLHSCQPSVAAAPAQSQLKRGAEPILAEAKSDCWVVTPTSRLIPALAQKPA